MGPIGPIGLQDDTSTIDPRLREDDKTGLPTSLPTF